MSDAAATFAEVKTAWTADLDRVAARDRWGRALMGVGAIHLGSFLVCQILHSRGDRTGWHFVAIWGAELAASVLLIRALAGRGWHRSSPLAGLIVRVWATFLILSLNLAAMNAMTGLDHEWFKPVLCTLGAFGFMMMAYLVSPWFLAAAVQMYFTGLLMLRNLDSSYLIHGLSWWLTLTTLGLILELRRRRVAASAQPVRVTVPAAPVVAIRYRTGTRRRPHHPST